MKRRLLSLVLILSLALTLAPGSLAASRWVEANSPEALAEALAPRARVFSLSKSNEPARVLLLSDGLDGDFGAARVIHCAALGQFVLEYPTAAEAETALRRLTEAYGADRCWLDTPETGASVLDPDDGTDEVEDEPTESPAVTPTPAPEPTPTPSPEATPTPAPETTPAPARTALSWGAAAMDLDDFFTGGQVQRHCAKSRCVIAVLDTGADLTLEALQGLPISSDSYDFVNATGEITDVTAGSAAGHGTTVTALLGDLLPDRVELMLLRVFDNSGSASRSRVRAAIVYALEHGADVINMSLGWEGADSSFRFLDDVLERSFAEGTPVVCAAGNASDRAETCYPASFRTTVAVSAINKSLNYELFSNYGDPVDFTAPGSGIRTVGPGGAVTVVRGTSYAAPHITAAMADMLLLRPELTAQGLYAALKACAEDLGVEGKDPLYGWGLPRLGAFSEANVTHVWDAGHTRPLATRENDGARVYRCTICGAERSEPIPATADSAANPFEDVSREVWYARAVTWALANHITAGYGSDTIFAPDESCTRAQMVTFLWRAAGEPAPKTARSPFEDVQNPDDYSYKAVLWAVEHQITDGVSPTAFAPASTVTRGQTVTFLWRMAGRPAARAENPFWDAPLGVYYHDAVLWAVEQGVTNGMDETHFAPDNPCTRGQIVTFLYRDLGGGTL